MDNTRVYRRAFASACPHYVTKVEKKGRAKEELHTIIHAPSPALAKCDWLTGYNEKTLQQVIAKCFIPIHRGRSTSRPSR